MNSKHKKTSMDYKGYIATVEYDDEAEIFHGDIINIRDVITFQADTVAGLKQEMMTSVDEYLRWCEEEGREPERPFSGKFQLRLNPEEHRRIHLAARRAGLSLNEYIRQQLLKAVS